MSVAFTVKTYALRGLFEYHLLVTVGGIGADNQLLGIPVYDEFLEPDDNLNIPRATFTESINQIYADLNKALEYLTMDDYVDIASADELPTGTERIGYYQL